MIFFENILVSGITFIINFRHVRLYFVALDYPTYHRARRKTKMYYRYESSSYRMRQRKVEELPSIMALLTSTWGIVVLREINMEVDTFEKAMTPSLKFLQLRKYFVYFRMAYLIFPRVLCMFENPAFLLRTAHVGAQPGVPPVAAGGRTSKEGPRRQQRRPRNHRTPDSLFGDVPDLQCLPHLVRCTLITNLKFQRGTNI